MGFRAYEPSVSYHNNEADQSALQNPDYANLDESPKNMKPGLKCDLFITHGWAEGIFEFVDKAGTFLKLPCGCLGRTV